MRLILVAIGLYMIWGHSVQAEQRHVSNGKNTQSLKRRVVARHKNIYRTYTPARSRAYATTAPRSTRTSTAQPARTNFMQPKRTSAPRRQRLIAQNTNELTATNMPAQPRHVHSMDNSQTTVRAQRPTTENETSTGDFGAVIQLEGSSNLRDTSDSDYKAANTFLFKPSYKIIEQLTLAARIEATKHYESANEDTELENTQLILIVTPLELSGDRTLGFTFTGVLPTNEKDRTNNTFNGGTGALIDLTQKYSFLDRAGSISYAVSGMKNYHDFDRNNAAEPNLSYRFRQIVTLRQDLSDSFHLQIIGRYQTGWTYQDAFKSAFLISEEISYDITKTFAVYVSHTNDGDALKSNGIDYNIKAYDKKSSSFATGLTATF